MIEEQIEVVLDDSVLTIRGDRRPAACEDRRTVHAMGIPYGPFAADVFLPFAVDHDGVEAAYENGVSAHASARAAATTIADRRQPDASARSYRYGSSANSRFPS